jgi:hypothetical protein
MLGYASTFLPHPAHSPDLHQVIEHRFAELKQHLVNRVYQLGFENVTTAALRLFVLEYCMTITPQLIQADIQNLVKCYQVVRAPIGSSVLINNRSVDGVAGGWPPDISGDTLTFHGVSCALAAPWQQQQSWFVCPGLCRTCAQSVQRSACVRGVV